MQVALQTKSTATTTPKKHSKTGNKTGLHELPKEYVHAVWPKLSKLLDLVEPYSNNECTTEQGKTYLISGQAQAFILAGEDLDPKGVIVGEWKMTPGKRIFFITTLGGSNALYANAYAQLEAWVKKHGGTHIQGAGRDSIVRLMQKRWGYKPVYTVVEKEMTL